jgi:Family of unknown function (DUF6029)
VDSELDKKYLICTKYTRMKKTLTIICALTLVTLTNAQDKGVISGNFQTNFSVFVLDSSIGAYEPPQYSSQISSSESWLFLNYQLNDFSIAARYDVFNNSNLLNPTGTFSGHGLGFWQVRKKIENLTITGGSFYDQFGSGLIFRAYENRLIGIDYAIQGVHVKYQLTPEWFVKAFSGNQKGAQSNRFGSSGEFIKGFNSERNLYLKGGKGLFTVGASGLNRTLTRGVMNELATEINGYPLPDRFDPKYNVYAYSGYVNAAVGNVSASFEYNGKTKEAVRDQDLYLIYEPGYIVYGTLGFAKSKLGKDKKGGIGINIQYRKIENYQLKNTPNEQLLNGLISYQPSLTRQAAYRLLARYNAPAQNYGEQGFQSDLVWTISKGKIITLNYSNIKRLSGEELFREYFIDYEQKFNRKFKAKVGLQSIFYNQQVYELKDPSYYDVNTVTPFLETTYKVSRRNSIRFAGQYLITDEDLGTFLNGILELNMSPHYSLSITDMVNVKPVRHANGAIISDEIVHYWTVFGKYNIHTTSFTIAYVRQVEGVTCTGGICRIEPAFSGVKFTLASNF